MDTLVELFLGDIGQGEQMSVTVRYGASATHRVACVPLHEERFKNLRSQIENGLPVPGTAAVEQFGQLVSSALLDPQAQAILNRAVDDAGSDGTLALHLVVDDVPWLLSFPWEYLFDDLRRQHFALCQTTRVVRRVTGVKRTHRTEKPVNRYRILYCLCKMADDPILDLDREEKWVRETYAPLLDSKAVQIDFVRNPTLTRLQDELTPGQYHIVHFSTHGAEPSTNPKKRGIYIAHDEGGVQLLDTDGLALLLGTAGVRLVVLNACATADSLIGGLLRRDVPAIIGMQFSYITETAANIFTRTFYRFLAKGLPVDAAMTHARLRIAMDIGQEKTDWGVPVLYLNSLTADEVLPPLQAPRRDLPADVSARELPVQAPSSTRRSALPTGDFASIVALAGGEPPRTATHHVGILQSIIAPREQPLPRVTAERIGIWDINAKIGGMERILGRMNKVASAFEFVSLQKAPSSQVFEQRGRPKRWQCNLNRATAELRQLLAEKRVSRIVGLTCYPVSGDGHRTFDMIWDFTADRKVALLSTEDLEWCGRKAGKTYEQVVIYLVVALLLNLVERRLENHDETLGCPLDFCAEVGDFLKGLKNPVVCGKYCINRIRDKKRFVEIERLFDLVRENPATFAKRLRSDLTRPFRLDDQKE